MAKKSSAKDLSDEEIIRIGRMRITETGASTFTQTSLDTQLSVERGVIWMIHFIEFDFETVDLLSEVAAGGVESIEAQITRESKTGPIRSNDADIVQRRKLTLTRSAAIGTDAGPLYAAFQNILRVEYPIPLPYASQSIFLGILGTDAGTAHTIAARIGYTVREVSDKFFFRVAQALLG